MLIDIDIMRIQDGRGKAVAYYCPAVHWTLDDMDTIPPEKINELCAKVAEVVREGLRGAEA